MEFLPAAPAIESDAELGARWLHQNDVRTLIDLRTLGEREGDGFMAASEHLDSLHRGLLDEVWSWEAENAAEDDWFLRDRTLEMYERFPDRIAQVLRDIAAAPANVLFHCTAGKDRTGMVAALLLSLAGVPRSDIVHDYAISARYLEPMMRISPQMATMARQNPKIIALRGSPAESIEAFLDALVAGRSAGRSCVAIASVRVF